MTRYRITILTSSCAGTDSHGRCSFPVGFSVHSVIFANDEKHLEISEYISHAGYPGQHEQSNPFFLNSIFNGHYISISYGDTPISLKVPYSRTQ
jgi:hypothetical protein